MFWIYFAQENNRPVMGFSKDISRFTDNLDAFEAAHRHCFVWKHGGQLKVWDIL